ncbi:tetratricopeptide repeat protein [Thiomicrorhabdus xiamenensis]|uniref:Tetratricopeptide repeat protein n=1 Tax=Thiomicrorhabdus xiamenensis TaxID=2739063 RepID=A0A7D4TB94_9GAMM|nr:tetratricopeptide repeat protein [Thiomicrorhabdus xiamenensis]QKI89646.1 tetratricopeptide repeat protein [Thiomicrorhabdus xiamenensis]
MTQAMIADINQENFSELVAFASKRHPVALVFWSDKNTDSLQMKEAWEALAQQFAGKIILAKLNVDQENELAKKLGFEQLPLCKMVKDEAFIAEQNQWSDKAACEALLHEVVPQDPSEAKREQAINAIRHGDFVQAERLMLEAIELNNNHPELHLDLLDIFLKQGKNQAAETLFQQLPESIQHSPRGKYFGGIFYFADKANQGPDINTVQNTLAENPDDPQALYAIACILMLNGRIEQGLQALLKRLQIESAAGIDKQAQEALVQAFNMLAPFKPELVKTYRRQMQNILS